MRVNVYAEEITDCVEIISEEIDGIACTGVRFYLEPLAAAQGKNSVTFWGKHQLKKALEKALALLDSDKNLHKINQKLVAERFIHNMNKRFS